MFLTELGLADLTRVLCAGNPMRSHGSWPGDVPSPRNLGPGGGPGLRCAGGLTHLPFVYRRLNACGSSLISGAKVPGAKLVLSGGFLRALLQEPLVVKNFGNSKNTSLKFFAWTVPKSSRRVSFEAAVRAAVAASARRGALRLIASVRLSATNRHAALRMGEDRAKSKLVQI